MAKISWAAWYNGPNGGFKQALADAGYSSLTDTPPFEDTSFEVDDLRLQVEDALMSMWESGKSPEEAVMELEEPFFSEEYNIDLNNNFVDDRELADVGNDYDDKEDEAWWEAPTPDEPDDDRVGPPRRDGVPGGWRKLR